MVLGRLTEPASQPAWLCGVVVPVDGVAWTAGTPVLDMCQSLRASSMTALLKAVQSVVTRASASAVVRSLEVLLYWSFHVGVRQERVYFCC
jgi:hypothetical protein